MAHQKLYRSFALGVSTPGHLGSFILYIRVRTKNIPSLLINSRVITRSPLHICGGSSGAAIALRPARSIAARKVACKTGVFGGKRINSSDCLSRHFGSCKLGRAKEEGWGQAEEEKTPPLPPFPNSPQSDTLECFQLGPSHISRWGRIACPSVAAIMWCFVLWDSWILSTSLFAKCYVVFTAVFHQLVVSGNFVCWPLHNQSSGIFFRIQYNPGVQHDSFYEQWIPSNFEPRCLCERFLEESFQNSFFVTIFEELWREISQPGRMSPPCGLNVGVEYSERNRASTGLLIALSFHSFNIHPRTFVCSRARTCGSGTRNAGKWPPSRLRRSAGLSRVSSFGKR